MERRQLTVVFCDLVGSVELSQRLDPEDLRRVIRAYQTACEPVIERHGGFVSRFLGDGILAFFGYPQAREGDAEQSVHAGLDMVQAVRAVDWSGSFGLDRQLSVRVGIATGLVVAGDLIGKGAAEEEAVVGETPNLAARLQSLAAPGTVLISSRTRRLAGRRFRLTELGKHVLKGIEQPIDVWRVDAPSDASARLETVQASTDTIMVDRHEELNFLLDRWERCKRHVSQLVLLSGEAGIGKSRLSETLRERISSESHLYMRFQCSAYHSNTAMYPITTHMERAARVEQNDSDAAKRQKLRDLIPESRAGQGAEFSAIAALLSIPGTPDDEFERLGAREKKLATFNVLVHCLTVLARTCPLLVVVEDIHWSDPTSRELLERFVKDSSKERVLVVLTCRANSPVAVDDFPGAEHLRLSRLGSRYSVELVKSIASGNSLPTALIERIVDKADGVPLFAEELARTFLTNAPSGTAGGGLMDTGLASEIPDTLHDLLMSRLDRLGPGKRVAQISAVIGRQFSPELVRRVADMSDGEFREGMANLSNSGLVVAESGGFEVTYVFRHALIRDAAYGSLLRAERRQFHERIAARLEAESALVAPEVLARHYTEAGLDSRAIECWLQAGQAASQRSAHREATSQFENGLKLLRRHPSDRERDRKLLKYLISLGPTLIATCGSGAAETEAVYREAVELTKSLPESEDHFTALWGWWRISKNFRTKARRAATLQRLAERLGDEGLKLQAHHCQWPTRFYLGDHVGCREHVEAGIALYSGDDYRSHASRYGGHDARSCALGGAAQALWLMGYPEAAVEHMRRARLWAEELQQLGSLVNVMDSNLLLLRYRCEPEATARQAAELVAVAEENELPEYLAKARVFLGWSTAKLGDVDAGIDTMRTAIASHEPIGTNEDPPVWLEMLADGYCDGGHYQAGLDTIDEAFRSTDRSGLTFWLPEFHRRRGELLQRKGEAFLDEARDSFERAITLSIEQGARSLELRATLSLTKDSSRRGDASVTAERLRGIMTWFDEGFETDDYRRAVSLLDSMGSR